MAAKLNMSKRKGAAEQTDAVQAAIDCGIDISMIVDNLQRSVAERIRRHQIALNTAEKLRKAKRL